MKILITGANGYIGKGIVKKLLKDNNIIIATDRKISDNDSRIIAKECDLFEIENPYEYFEKPDIVLHLAWRDGFIHNSNAHFEDLPKHYKFIKSLCESGIKQIAVMGTMHEIGFYEGCIKEDTPTNPMTLYGISKNALRKSTEIIAKENNVIYQWLRAYYIVGNSMYGNSIFSKITDSEKKGLKEFPFTTGQNQYDFTNYEDCCEQISSAVSQSEVNGIINICSGYPEKLADRVERFIKENGYSIKLKYGAYPDRPYDSKAVWGDSTKIKKILSKQKGLNK